MIPISKKTNENIQQQCRYVVVSLVQQSITELRSDVPEASSSLIFFHAAAIRPDVQGIDLSSLTLPGSFDENHMDLILEWARHRTSGDSSDGLSPSLEGVEEAVEMLDGGLGEVLSKNRILLGIALVTNLARTDDYEDVFSIYLSDIDQWVSGVTQAMICFNKSSLAYLISQDDNLDGEANVSYLGSTDKIGGVFGEVDYWSKRPEFDEDGGGRDFSADLATLYGTLTGS